METKVTQDQKYHRKFAVDLFNYAWTLLEKPERTREEDDTMLNAAHASRLHWEMVGKPVNLVRGEWQISHVYCVLSRIEPALYHARRCLEICNEQSISDFDLAYAYEALARAYSIAVRPIECKYYIKLAMQAGQQIAKPEDRDQFFNDLGTVQAPDFPHPNGS
jgi:hypothetical protein